MGRSWHQAASTLLAALGLRIALDPHASPHQLSECLRGSGLRARHIALDSSLFLAEDGMVGALLETEDGAYLATLGGGMEAALVGEDGRIARALDPADTQAARQAWILEENLTDLGNLSPFFARYRQRFAEIFTSALIINLFALLLPLFSSFVYDKILGNGITTTLWALVIGLCLVLGVEFCVRMLRLVAAERFAVGSEVDIDDSTFRNLLDAQTTRMPSVGSLLEKYKQVMAFRDFLSSSYFLALADIPFLVLFLAVIAVVAGPLVFVAILCGALMMGLSLVFMPPVLTYDRHARAAGEQRFGLMTDVLTAREAVIGGAFRRDLTRRWSHASLNAAAAASKARYWRGFGMTVTNSVSYLSYIGVLVGGVYMVEGHSLTAGGLLAA